LSSFIVTQHNQRCRTNSALLARRTGHHHSKNASVVSGGGFFVTGLLGNHPIRCTSGTSVTLSMIAAILVENVRFLWEVLAESDVIT
jgi:hypothetical protein